MNIHTILRQINRDLVPQFEDRLREHLQSKDREWLIEQIVRLTLDAHSLQENDRKIFMEQKEKRRAERRARLKDICLNCDVLESFLYKHRNYTRESMMNDGYLLDTAYIKGTNMIDEKHRTDKGNQLLTHAKDMLFGLLFGDEKNKHTFRQEGKRDAHTCTPTI